MARGRSILGAVWGVSTLALLLPGLDGARQALLILSAVAAIAIVGLGLLRSLRGPQIASSRSGVSASTSATVRSSDSETR